MRTYGFLLMVLVAACNDPPGAGTEGHPCRTFYPCDDGLRCMDGTCTACGEPGDICCADPGGPERCDGNIACVGAADGYGTCEGECGQPGGPCCGDSCNSGTCYLGTCPTESSDPCYVDGDPHTVVVIDAMCNSQVVTFLTKDEAEAEACRDQLVLQPGEEACAVDTKPETTTVCEDGFGPVYFDHCSDQQLATCETNKCANCEYTETSGSCPHGP